MSLRPALITLLLILQWAPSLAIASDDWVAESNVNTEFVMQQQARFTPETFASLGIEGVDADISDLGPKLYERSQKDTKNLIKELQNRKKTTEDPRVLQDLDILIKSLKDQHHTTQLNHEHLLPYYNLSQSLFFGFKSLLDPRNDPARYPAALERLKKYTGQAKGFKPVTELAKARSWERFDIPGLLGPFRAELEKDLSNVPRFKAGLQKTFAESGLEGYEADLKLLTQQLDDYAVWLKKELAPRAREDARLPEALYTDNLKNFGVDMDPMDLIKQAQLGFAQIQFRMKAVARQVAESRGLASNDYRQVMLELQKEQISAEEIMPYYKARLADIETIIRDNDLVTVPDRPAAIRPATEAESAAAPAPFMSPPQLIGNTGQPGEFVLVSKNPSDDSGEAMNDFGSAASTWALTAHEARPGHEMQFAAMLENGVSQARAIYAFNSANVEGWGLYAEAFMLEYFSPEAQLLGLRSLLMRAARAFLDPMLNLGLIEREQAVDFLVEEVGISKPLAKQEADRYTFLAPGQATSYYVGYMNLMSLRTEVELRMRERFKQREYHDFLLQQGLLPPDILRQAVLDNFVAEPTTP